MGWGSIAGAAISTVGSMASSAMNNRSAKQMAATSAQTRVKDLRAAGLNPILAATNGSLQAAQVPQQQTPDYSPIARVFEQNTGRMNANSARQQADNNAKQVDSTVALQGAQSAKTLADTKVALNQVDVQNAQKNLINEQALTQSALRANYAANSNLASANTVRANYQATQDKVMSDWLNTETGQDTFKVNQMTKGGKTNPGTLINLGNSALKTIQERYKNAPKPNYTQGYGPYGKWK
ncbi:MULTISPECIES: hypothetical protein [Enterobacter cloacae complex]|uniref:hypothetical protein n=1 Tax=Enterobacter cloacae complex TaxID=354276 RepID=UPI00077BC3B1|nr:hypothetical protein [Enterobacter cloacae]MCK6804091.1 hypothetical protein [Enterobacter cloacae]MCK6826992.1 hypothetical protein [Enterobacter cloacae]